MKFHDLDVDDAVVGTGTIAQDSCNIIAQGITESTRVGRKCTIRRINWKFEITMPTTAVAGSTSDIVRVVLYHDKQTNGAAAAVLDILETADFQSFRNLAQQSRFNILMDRMYTVHCPSGSGRGSTDTLSYGEQKIFDTFYKTCNIAIEYDTTASTGVLTTQRTNNIGVMLLSQSGFAGFTSKMRLRFTDN